MLLLTWQSKDRCRTRVEWRYLFQPQMEKNKLLDMKTWSLKMSVRPKACPIPFLPPSQTNHSIRDASSICFYLPILSCIFTSFHKYCFSKALNCSLDFQDWIQEVTCHPVQKSLMFVRAGERLQKDNSGHQASTAAREDWLDDIISPILFKNK